MNHCYQSRNPLARTSPLRSIPLFQSASILLRAPAPVFAPVPEPVFAPGYVPPPPPSAEVLARRELECAEASLREYVWVYDFARREIGEANRTHSEALMHGTHVVSPAKPFTKERIRERKSYAFKMFNKRRGQLSAARKRVDAARIALGLPTLAVVEQRQVVAAEVRASKQRPVVSHLSTNRPVI